MKTQKVCQGPKGQKPCKECRKSKKHLSSVFCQCHQCRDLQCDFDTKTNECESNPHRHVVEVKVGGKMTQVVTCHVCYSGHRAGWQDDPEEEAA